MNALEATTFTLGSPEHGSAFVRRWDGEAPPHAVVMIAHGVSEHSERYDRLARELATHGYRVYASDHRGHGHTAAEGSLGDAGPQGWDATLDDLHAVLQRAGTDAPGLPIVLLGHSMGAILAQRFIASHGAELAAVVLSGTVTNSVADAELFAVARTAAGAAPHAPSELFGMMFAGFNEPFEQVTGFEWLSRDPAEVRKYVDDPMSGMPLSNATLANFLPGWEEAMSERIRTLVPHALPVLLISGDRDPAGGDGQAPRALAEAYRALGVSDVTLKLYPGARHELFNETNRDEVVRDLIAWLDEKTRTVASL